MMYFLHRFFTSSFKKTRENLRKLDEVTFLTALKLNFKMNSLLKQKIKTKLIFCFLIFLLIMLKLLQRTRVEKVHKQRRSNLCYNLTEADILPSIEVLKPQENSIFFHETSCRGGLTSRQACTVESAATAHPNRQVYVLFNSPVKNKDMLRKVHEFGNVNVARIHLNYSEGTIIDNVFKKVYNFSRYPIVHAADVLRFLTLYKWSGIYLDLDTIVVRTLDRLGNNWAAKEDEESIAVGALAFSSDDVGRTAIRSVVEEIQQSYDPELWNHNGNGAMTRAFQRYCNVSRIKYIDTAHCNGFRIHSPAVLYPVYWFDAQVYFVKGDLLPAETQYAYIHHMWNQLTSILRIENGSPYSDLAKLYCPVTYNSFRVDFGNK